VLSLVTAAAVALGLFATLILGFLAGSHSTGQPTPSTKTSRSGSTVNAPGDVTFFPEMPSGIAQHSRLESGR
jgi:hypothetical protein